MFFCSLDLGIHYACVRDDAPENENDSTANRVFKYRGAEFTDPQQCFDECRTEVGKNGWVGKFFFFCTYKFLFQFSFLI